MKKALKIMIFLVVSSTILVSCNDLLGVDSSRLVTDKEYGHSPNDSLYSTFGILSKLQKLADSYVLLGELRGDLLDVTESSDISLREIYSFDISKNNKYVDLNKYYDVINNCNYVLKNLDSSKVDAGRKLELSQYAAIKSIRAWTYMQIALNFKTATYYVDPILTIEDSKKTYPEYTIEELADILIADLIPLKDVPMPNIGSVGSYYISYSYFPIRFLLGDLYLWKGDYQNAATEYHDLMFKNYLIVNKAFSATWQTDNNTISNAANINWLAAFWVGNGEVISTITCPTQFGQRFDLDSLNYQGKIVPSKIALDNWANQTYFLNEASNAQGDLRKYGSVWQKSRLSSTTSFSSEFKSTDFTANKDYNYILKYKLYGQNVVVYRTALLYLRYAEAVNRLNKPNLAFAVLKNGLNSTTMFNHAIIPVNEKDSATAALMNFNDFRFNNNAGIRMRGVGNADKDTTFYVFHQQANMKDSVLYVENLIQQELALETAFEGNRFHDLMRIAFRRIKNGEGDASYLANLVSKKHVGNEAAIKTKLMNTDNWFINKKE
jgi:starch-binding outer membrane protein, SusD/RagB family